MAIFTFTLNAHEEGPGSRLTMWFFYGGGILTGDQIRLPGYEETYKNGDPCPDGSSGKVQVLVDGAALADWSAYIPAEGDQIRLVFGPDEEAAP